ncbi:hypothetical protein MUK42_32975 [Musa troglodytarum]|uniref:Uncharacterized protein n=1 Tax=Musa troglodytarum TaxID=320322 RepID=A0A9E7I5W4_9LILI|nr:hypothetical protein MUK42_32975 [Musa troglodytarum]
MRSNPQRAFEKPIITYCSLTIRCAPIPLRDFPPLSRLSEGEGKAAVEKATVVEATENVKKAESSLEEKHLPFGVLFFFSPCP